MKWMIDMEKDQIGYKIFDYIRNRRAVTRNEITVEFGLPSNYVGKYVDILLSRGMVFQGEPIQSKTRKCSRVKIVGITNEDIKRKEEDYLSNVSEEDLQTERYKKVLEFVQGHSKAIIPSDALLELQKTEPNYSNLGWVATILRDLWKRRLIIRSPFSIPPDCLTGVKAKRGSYVYGISEDAVRLKILELAPKEVRNTYYRIMNEAKVFASFHLKKLTGISIVEEDCDSGMPKLRQWFIMRFVKSGWIKYELYKQMGYFWRPSIPVGLALAQIRELHPKAIEYRLECQNLGRLSEKKALWTFVTWAKLSWGLKIEIPDYFPKNIPSWFNGKDIEKFKITTKSPTGTEIETLNSGVWKFDLNPLDYVIFTSKDLLLNSRYCGFGINCKYVGKKIGLPFLRNMVLALRDGKIQKYKKDSEGKKRPVDKSIPLGGFLTPVIFCKQVFGSGIFWKKVNDYGAIIITQSKVDLMESELKKQFGLEFPHSKQIQKMMEKVRLYEQYQKNALATGRDAVEMVNEVVQ